MAQALNGRRGDNFVLRLTTEERAERDVHTLKPPPERVHGILCAPPCTEFSKAKNGRRRDIRGGLETVSACLRLVCACRPVWWCLENPVGLLSAYLGTPRDVFEPFEFGDPWTKPTALWGEFRVPERGPYVKPTSAAVRRSSAEARRNHPRRVRKCIFSSEPLNSCCISIDAIL